MYVVDIVQFTYLGKLLIKICRKNSRPSVLNNSLFYEIYSSKACLHVDLHNVEY